MIPTDFSIEIADWNNPQDRDACRSVRDCVFIDEQQVPREDEEDEFDGAARHVLARDAQGNAIGTGRLTPQRMIGRMAVLRDWRGKNIGTAILNTLIEQARALHYPEVQMHAQTHAVPFYEAFGFVCEGDEFSECEILHFHMRMPIAAAPAPTRPGPSPRPEVRSCPVETRDQAQAETLRLINDAKRELCIYSRALDPDILDNEDVLEALKQLGIRNRGANVRFVVQEPRKPAQYGHRLIALAQRLTSVFSFRTPVEDNDLQYPSAFLLNDTGGYYFRVLGNRYEGEAVNYAPGRHAQLRDYFDQVWERSEPSDELRQLSL
ncbi:MAG: GNAT family N-acetyltransferase [Rudaea sp.]